MREQLLETWERIQAFLKTSIQQIENSVWFERILIRYESADPRTQRRVIAGLRLSVGVIAALAVLIPLWSVVSSKSTLAKQRVLLAEIRAFNEDQASIPEKPRPPRDWQDLPAATPEQTKSSLEQFLGTINLPEGTYVLDGGFGPQMTLQVDELNLRQAMALLFQLDGWFPRVQVTSLRLGVHPEKKDLTRITIALNHRGGGGAADSPDFEPDAEGEGLGEDTAFVDETPPTRTTMPRGTSRPSNEDDGADTEPGFMEEPPPFDDAPPSGGRGSVSPSEGNDDDDFDFDSGDDGGDLPPPPFEDGDL
jgi:hypothetical protein